MVFDVNRLFYIHPMKPCAKRHCKRFINLWNLKYLLDFNLDPQNHYEIYLDIDTVTPLTSYVDDLFCIFRVYDG